MRIGLVLLIYLATMNNCFALDNKYEPVVQRFIDYVKSDDVKKLSEITRFPIKREYPLPSINSKAEFVSRYKIVFDDSLKQIITSSQVLEDWNVVGWRGIILRDGDLWLDYDGKLIAINYHSELERKERTQLIENEKREIHPTLRSFSQPVLKCETVKFKIRIDDLGEYNYRYASWPKSKSMMDYPSLVLEKGKWVPDGSGGNHYYEFISGSYTYQIYVFVIGSDGTPLGALTVSKGQTEIVNQDIILLKQ